MLDFSSSQPPHTELTPILKGDNLGYLEILE